MRRRAISMSFTTPMLIESQRSATPALGFSGGGVCPYPIPAFAGTWFSFPSNEGMERRERRLDAGEASLAGD
jgi:hypothetical protein